MPLYFILKGITISHIDTTQIIHVKDWNLDFSTLASEIDSVVFTKTDSSNGTYQVEVEYYDLKYGKETQDAD